MKQTNKLKMIAAMAMCVLSFTITSCSSDDFYGFDDYGSFSSNDIWNNSTQYNDFSSLASVLRKISFYVDDNGCFHITDRYDEKMGISKSDYDNLVNMMYYTNDLINSDKKKRTKNNNREGGLPRTPDCFLYTLSHYGHGAPSYEQIALDCDTIFPEWRTYGVPTEAIDIILRKHSVNYLSSSNGFSYNIVDLDNAMVRLNGVTVVVNGHQYIMNHWVNGQSYYHDINGYDIIYYCDYQTMRFGLISIQSISKLYHHPSVLPES